MKIIVTGSMGQLGHAVRKLSSGSEHEYVFTDINDSEGVSRLDITDKEAVRGMVNGADVIVNCAAYTDVNGAEGHEALAMKVNAEAAGILAEAAREAGALLMHVSTDYVFDGKANVPYDEDAQPSPVNAYGRTKLEGEKAIAASGCRYMIFRTSWLYSDVGKNFYLTMNRLTAEKPELKVVMDQAGTPTNAYDLAFLICHIIETDMLDKTGVYNYSNDGVCSWYDFAREINNMLGHTCRVEPCRTDEFPSPAQRPQYSVLDKSKVKKTFGVEVPHWRESLQLLIDQHYN
jgi:dTDP-4-dehydrorhamnose reductase